MTNLLITWLNTLGISQKFRFWEMMIQTLWSSYKGRWTGFFPGLGWPVDAAGKMEEMIRDFAGKKPILGIAKDLGAI